MTAKTSAHIVLSYTWLKIRGSKTCKKHVIRCYNTKFYVKITISFAHTHVHIHNVHACIHEYCRFSCCLIKYVKLEQWSQVDRLLTVSPRHNNHHSPHLLPPLPSLPLHQPYTSLRGTRVHVQYMCTCYISKCTLVYGHFTILSSCIFSSHQLGTHKADLAIRHSSGITCFRHYVYTSIIYMYMYVYELSSARILYT